MYDNVMSRANAMANEFIENMEETTAKALGIDERAAWTVWRGDDCVAILKHDRARFNYYGGGEYVSKDCVAEIGDYVFNSDQDDRVNGWLRFPESDHDILENDCG